MKEAVNHQSLKYVISLKPKIIHISCHGAPDETDKTKKGNFYL